jgi:hypothetical protein
MARAQDKRIWLAGGAGLAVLILAIGWLAFISPQLSSAKGLRGQADTARARNTVLTTQVAKLKQQNDNVGQLRTTLRSALAALPFDSGLPTFTRQVAAQATGDKVKLTSITVGASTAAGNTASTPATPSTPTTGTGNTTGTTTTPTTGTTSTPTSGTVMAIPVTLLSSGTNRNQLAFLKAIQVTGPRRALVTSTAMTSSSTTGAASIDDSATMTTQLTVFTAPLDAAAQAQLTKLLSAK